MKALATAIIGLVGITASTAALGAETCDAVVAKRAWAKCSACHTADPGAKSGLGPNLSGVIGRSAASFPGYKYSPAMQKSGLKWTRKNFEAFIAAPQSVVPGTRMAFAGLKTPADRTALSCALQKGKP